MPVNLDKFFLLLETKINSAIDNLEKEDIAIGTDDYEKIINSIVNTSLILKNKKDFVVINSQQINSNDLGKLIGTKYERMDD
jgi:hypothetical protein